MFALPARMTCGSMPNSVMMSIPYLNAQATPSWTARIRCASEWSPPEPAGASAASAFSFSYGVSAFPSIRRIQLYAIPHPLMQRRTPIRVAFAEWLTCANEFTLASGSGESVPLTA